MLLALVGRRLADAQVDDSRKRLASGFRRRVEEISSSLGRANVALSSNVHGMAFGGRLVSIGTRARNASHAVLSTPTQCLEVLPKCNLKGLAAYSSHARAASTMRDLYEYANPKYLPHELSLSAFAGLRLRDPVLVGLRDRFPLVRAPTSRQREFIPAIVRANKDIFIRDSAGSGK